MRIKRSSFLPLALLYAIIFMSRGGYFYYIGLYYSTLQLSNAEIGLLSSIGALVGLVGQPLWGSITDYAPNKNRILQLTLLMTALAVCLLPLSGRNFLLLILAAAFLGFFDNTVTPLSDSIAIELAHKSGFKFSVIRTIGSVGFAVMAALAGKIFARNILYLFVVFALFRLLAFLVSFLIPPVKGYRKEEKPARLWEIFQDKKLTYIYVYVFILSCTNGFFSSFHAIYSQEVGIGTELLGIGIALGSFSQFPFMLLFDRLYQRLGIVKILLISGMIYSLRWFLYATALTPATLLLLWALHGGTFIVLYLCLAEYVSTSVAPELRTRGQMVNAMILTGISSILGATGGGLCAQWIGVGSTFFLSALFSAGAVLSFYVLMKSLARQNRETKNIKGAADSF
ncbi:MAG: MFS transporter [Firmicutes bacterium]|nr:MFS transporter [Bacillota bacterium]